MTNEPDDLLWQRLSRALFGDRKTIDEGLFTYGVMEEIRKLEPAREALAWHRFLRLAVPLLGAAAASLFLAVRAPSSSLSIETVLFQPHSTPADPLAPILEGLR